jgi:hypothetical protein
MAGPGRESKFTPECRDALLDGVAAGNTYAVAARRAGVGPRTVRRWLQRGRAGEEPFAAFLAAMKKAQAGVEDACVRGILAVGQGGLVLERTTRPDGTVTEKFSRPEWTALAWWLERTNPTDWGKDNEIVRKLFEFVRKYEAAEAAPLARGVSGG